jgi:putative phosphoesterase
MLNYCIEADEVWHAGDIGSYHVIEEIEKVSKIRAVYGNIDGADIRKEFPMNNIFTLENVKVFLTHIGGYPGRYEKRVREEISRIRPKLFISGHSHILKVQFDKKFGLLHMNPGAAGKYGFHKVRTLLRFKLDSGEIKDLEVIELKKS